ncbi:unnamed protein product [Clonostachys solani]|uniref:Nephrocystin 3-like N-terminal domain-containing protein n=1 Tax=Clonostachys solani TaxID=160281 RepID=A0A9N9Z8A6_9HYPO|nr:unnamed protein product [Clonostachys solani]
MDPVSAFRVAGTVVMFVDFCYGLVSESIEIYRSPEGISSENFQLSTLVKDLGKISTQVSDALDTATSQALIASDESLIRLCRECESITAEVNSALGYLQAQGGGSKAMMAKNSVTVALKAMWSKGNLQNIEKRLQQIRSEMTMAMLVSLWERDRTRGNGGSESLEHQISKLSQNIDRTNGKLDQFASELDKISSEDDTVGPGNRNVLFRRLWEADWHPSDAPIGDNGDLHSKSNNLNNQIHKQIVRGLHFSDISRRERSIPKPYDDTYRWIFERDDEVHNGNNEMLKGRNNFTNWLQDPCPVYWITGKPGSGKSTLMNFIVRDSRTRKNLQKWAAPFPLLLGHFYFWEAGHNNLQKTREGLLRTLLYQCLESMPDLTPIVLPRRWAVYQVLRGLETPAPAWSWEELQEAFFNLASLNGHSLKLALILDGLDEFSGDPIALISFIQELVTRYGVKICLGSRPLTEFTDAFDEYPRLAIQYLTQGDIEAYIIGNFQSSKAFRERQVLFPDQAGALLYDIATKAQGVFLWVFIVVRDLLYSLSKGRSLADLQAVVDDLPTDLFQLYSRMREKVDPQDLKNSTRYYQLTVASLRPLHAISLWIADGESLPNGDVFTEEHKENIVKILERRLDSSTKGLLEVDDDGIITFLHRTARDWVLQESMLSTPRKSLTNFAPELVLLQVLTTLISKPRLFIYLGFSQLAFWDLVVLGFLYASQVEECFSESLVHAVDDFDAALCERAADLGKRGYIFDANLSKSDSASSKTNRWLHRGGKRERSSSGKSNAGKHWSWTQDNLPFCIENSAVGIAAQFAVVPYVKAKLKTNKSLLKSEPNRRSLLENTIFGWQFYVSRTNEDLAHYSTNWRVLMDDLSRQRIEMVRLLLESGASTSDPTCRCRQKKGRSIEEEVSLLDSNGRAKVASREFWDELANLLLKTRRRSRLWAFFS